MKTLKISILHTVLLFSSIISAQTFPSKPIKIVAPFAAGGLADILARTLSEKLTKSMNQVFIVENRVGAGGNVGAEMVSRSDPDGYTLLMTSTGIMSINQFLYSNMNFDPQTAFTPIFMVADMPMVLVVRKDLPVKNLTEFIQLAKSKELFYGSPGNGTTGHLGMEFFMHESGVQLQHVPYKSAAEAVQAALSGQTSTMFDNPPSIISQIRAGDLRAIGVATRERIAILPDAPTLNELGLTNFEAY